MARAALENTLVANHATSAEQYSVVCMLVNTKGNYTVSNTNGQIAIYQTADGETQIDVRIEQDNVWLTQLQMSEVFDTTPENILMHLKNIFRDAELAESATAKDFLVVQTEGRRKKQYAKNAQCKFE